MKLHDYELLLDALPGGLPHGALTNVTLHRSEEPLYGPVKEPAHWLSTVYSLIRSSLAEQVPVYYVQCGGLFLYGNVLTVHQGLSSPLVRVCDDTDVIGMTPEIAGYLPHSQVPTYHGYHCWVPTLKAIYDDRRRHEEVHGPALLVLDDVAAARPYRQFLEEPSDCRVSPNMSSVIPVAAWQANDLVRLAAERPHAATVAVWYENKPRRIRAVRDAALLDMQLLRQSTPDHAVLRVRRRSRVGQPWAKALDVRVPAISAPEY